MNNPSLDTPRKPKDDRLDSWKKIAAYLSRDVTTVQRWEKREAMPVHRHLHERSGSVYAFRTEIDAWARGRRDLQTLDGPGAADSDAGPAQPPETGARPARKLGWLLTGVAVAAIVSGTVIQLLRVDFFWRNPLAGATYLSVTGFDGESHAAAVSRDGKFVAFLSDRSGRMDVWVTQAGSGQFHNLTAGVVGELVNPSVRELGFSPDGSLVTFWQRLRSGLAGTEISIWGVPTLGGEPRPFLPGAAEATWSPDGGQLLYHTPGPGDPLFVTDGKGMPPKAPILVAPAGLHSHYPVWAPGNQIYFVKGSLPDQLDIWRTNLQGAEPERITYQSTFLAYPVLLDERTLLYLANAPDGSGPWIYGMDLRRRVPHQLTSGVEKYTSLAASADGLRVIATVSIPERSLWRITFAGRPVTGLPERIALASGTGFAPRLGPDFLIYVATAGTGDSVWKLVAGMASQLWSAPDARIIGSPAISGDGRRIAFSVVQHGKSLLYSMAADGSGLRLLSGSLQLQGAPAWEPDGQHITSAAVGQGVPRLVRFPLDGSRARPLLSDYSVDPAWSSDGGFVVYSGPDIGTRFDIRASTATGHAHPLPPLKLTRGARHLVLQSSGQTLYFLQGELQHKDLWSIDLITGSQHQLTHLPPEFNVRDFDIAPDGHEAILERAQARSSVVAIDRAIP